MIYIDPSSSKDEDGISSERVQVYHQQQSPHLDQARKQQGPSGSQQLASSSQPDDENRPPATGLLWQPRDPPLQYSVIQQKQQRENNSVTKSRLEPRRSASLSQADLVNYDGKYVLGRQLQQQHSSQSPPRPPPPQESSAATRYQDYYETKYEKPIRRDPAIQQSRGRSGVTGVDVDTVWKSRWRSTSPPPAPVDDWIPIKPPQLAWAKPVHLPVVELAGVSRSSKKTSSRIPLPVNPNMARSMSGDMDHMIYLERDLPDSHRLVFRERTRSIDRGLAQHQHSHPHHRMAYKTYEEELADYHGRTGSVDRLASTQRGRPRTIRMGTQSQVGRSVPASLERRHSEVDRSSSRRRESGDSSNSSGGGGGGGGTRPHSSSRRGSNSTVDMHSEPSGNKSRSSNNSNVNRVYIHDGHQLEEPVVLRNASASAIRVTMTDSRSLKRPTQHRSDRAGQVHTPHPQSIESSTMPRMSKRHGVIQQQPARVTGVVQPQQHHSGTTTVYLGNAETESAPPPPHGAPGRSIHHGFDGAESGGVYRKVTTTSTKRIKTDSDGQGNDSSFSYEINHQRLPYHPPLLFFHLSPIQQTIL